MIPHLFLRVYTAVIVCIQVSAAHSYSDPSKYLIFGLSAHRYICTPSKATFLIGERCPWEIRSTTIHNFQR